MPWAVTVFLVPDRSLPTTASTPASVRNLRTAAAQIKGGQDQGTGQGYSLGRRPVPERRVESAFTACRTQAADPRSGEQQMTQALPHQQPGTAARSRTQAVDQARALGLLAPRPAGADQAVFSITGVAAAEGAAPVRVT